MFFTWFPGNSFLYRQESYDRWQLNWWYRLRYIALKQFGAEIISLFVTQICNFTNVVLTGNPVQCESHGSG
jgi:hypothetical protein